MNVNLCADGSQVIESRGRRLWEVHAAMGACGLINTAAKGSAPGGIMQTVVSCKGHPVVYEGLIIGSS